MMRIGRVVACLFLPMALGCTQGFHEFRQAGEEYVLAGDYTSAKAMFAEAYRIYPEHAENCYDLALCHEHFGRRQMTLGNKAAADRDLDRAVEYYSRAIEAFPGFRAALRGKNEVLELRGESEAALASTEWAKDYLGPSAERHIELANELAERGDLDAALLRYRQAAAMEPDSAPAHAALGWFYFKLGRKEAGIEELQRAYRLNRDEPGVRDELLSLKALPSISRREGVGQS